MIDPGPSPAPRRPFARWIKIVLSLALLSVTAILVGAPSLYRSLSWPADSRPSTLAVAAIAAGVALAFFFAWRFGRRFVARAREVALAGGRVLFAPGNMAVHLPLSFLLLGSH